MIDRVGSFAVSHGRLGYADRGAERPVRGGEFEDVMRGAAAQTEQTAASPSPLRLSRLGSRGREAGQPAGAALDSGRTSATTAAPRTRTASASSGDAAPKASTLEQPGGSATSAASAAETAPGTHFVRSTSTIAPKLVRFSEVPESAQYPMGPYRQAPPEFGGEWWFVNPFTGPEPWRSLEFADAPAKAVAETEPPPADFVRLFGPRPNTRTAAAQWDLDLSYFQGTGLPEGFNASQLAAATKEFEAWGLGEPVFYQGRYGWQVRFPDSQLPMFETTASTALLVPHLVIAEHQARAVQEGETLARYHPFLPERLRPA